jgi:hypothetical protein
MNERLSPDALRAAFLAESASVLPSVEWTVGDGLVFPEVSPSLGTLEVGFDWGEITMYFGHRGYHQHHTPDDDLTGSELEDSIRQSAREAVEFVAALTRDQVVCRWGLLVSGTYRNARPGAVRRMWRLMTPWVREAVWSGAPPLR